MMQACGGIAGAYQQKAYCFAKLACDAALLSSGVSSQDMLPSEARADGSLFERVVDLRPCNLLDRHITFTEETPSQDTVRRIFC